MLEKILSANGHALSIVYCRLNTRPMRLHLSQCHHMQREMLEFEIDIEMIHF